MGEVIDLGDEWIGDDFGDVVGRNECREYVWNFYGINNNEEK